MCRRLLRQLFHIREQFQQGQRRLLMLSSRASIQRTHAAPICIPVMFLVHVACGDAALSKKSLYRWLVPHGIFCWNDAQVINRHMCVATVSQAPPAHLSHTLMSGRASGSFDSIRKDFTRSGG